MSLWSARPPVPLKKPALHRALLLLLLFLTIPCFAQNSSAANDNNGWKLVWSDEFNGPNGSSVDTSKWVIETGGKGWGNHELEYYTDRPENSFIQDGHLVIRALKEKYKGRDRVTRNYTSARMKTFGKFSQKYGRFEARIKVPAGQGMWPAFWLLGNDIEEVGWPACGEVDIMENIGKEPSIVHGSIHGPGYTGTVGLEAPYTLPAGQRFSDDYHVFAVEWGPDSVAFYVDKTLYVTRTPANLRPGWKWVFDKPYFLILNLAVGGDWPGAPDRTTKFPKDMLVDYVRVYERSEPPAKEPTPR
ncbi:MAG TPA: glycoside hydrolase family 16 protein [Terriglobales bacterium]|nr:glycoside hydrolase family 16 protein [Terriglobales bacterium]